MTESRPMRRAEEIVSGWAERLAGSLEPRRQLLRCDADPDAWVDFEPQALELLVDLGRVVSGAALDESELFLAVTRPARRLSRVGEVEIVLRWQWADTGAGAPNVVPLRPVADDEDPMTGMPVLRALLERFSDYGWHGEAETLPRTQECRIRLVPKPR